MPYEISWYQERRIILGRFSGILTIEDAYRWGADVIQHIDEGSALVHLMIDVSALQKFPTNILQLKATAAFLNHPNLGWMMLVGSSSLLNTLSSIIAQLTGREFRSFKTVDLALDFLMKQDETLTVGDS